MADFLRSESARRRRESEVALDAVRAAESADDAPANDEDDTLVLFFMCCHPALTPASAIVLYADRAVGGLTTGEIAHAFLVPEATMAQRISRAKQTIAESGIPFDGRSRRNRPSGCGKCYTCFISCSTKATPRQAGPALIEPIWHVRPSASRGQSTGFNQKTQKLPDCWPSCCSPTAR